MAAFALGAFVATALGALVAAAFGAVGAFFFGESRVEARNGEKDGE